MTRVGDMMRYVHYAEEEEGGDGDGGGERWGVMRDGWIATANVVIGGRVDS